MKKILLIFIILIFLSMGFIINLKIYPYREDIYSFAKNYFYKKFFPIWNIRRFSDSLLEKNIIIKKIDFYPWTVRVIWEESYTWIVVKNKDKENWINQNGIRMNYFKEYNTIKVDNNGNFKEEEIINIVKSLSKNLEIKDLVLNTNYFMIKNKRGTIIMNYDDYKEKLKYINIIDQFLDEDNYLIDMRFKIPCLRD